MAERKVIDCDRCGNEIKDAAHQFTFFTDSSPDPSGNGTEYETSDVDLCPTCMGRALDAIIPVMAGGRYNCEFNRRMALVLRGKSPVACLVEKSA